MQRSIIIKLIFAGLFAFFIFGNIKSIQSARSSLSRIDGANARLEAIEDENLRIISEIDYVKTPEYLDKVALERFNMTRNDSTILVLQGAKTREEINIAKRVLEQPKEHTRVEKWGRFFGL